MRQNHPVFLEQVSIVIDRRMKNKVILSQVGVYPSKDLEELEKNVEIKWISTKT